MPRIKSSADLHPGDPVVIFPRVSTSQQSYRAQLIWLLRQVYRQGGSVVGIHPCSRSGKSLSPELRDAIGQARHWPATLIAFSVDRLIRHPNFSPRDSSTWQLQARDVDLAQFWEWAKGVRVMTLLDPRATPDQVWSYHTKRGLWLNTFDAAGTCAPGWTSRRRRTVEPVVERLRADGFRWGQISNWLNVPIDVLKDWNRKLSKSVWISTWRGR